MPKGLFTPFTEYEKLKIKNEYLTKSVKKLANELNTTYGRIMRFLNNNNLQIPPEIIEQRKQESRRKIGDVPFNKGKKQIDYMTAEAIEKTKLTRFKKGNAPHNINPDGNGAIVKRKDATGRFYKYIRIDKGIWHLYHRVIWENLNGEIPANHVVVFKDNNNENTVIENLELISMTENMLRNSKHSYPKEIIPSMVLLKKIETKLNKIKNG